MADECQICFQPRSGPPARACSVPSAHVVSDRDAFREARDAGLKARHETREARAVRKAVAEEIAQALEAERIVRHCTPEGMACFGIAASLAREIGSRDPA